jgi:hypothetical protein
MILPAHSVCQTPQRCELLRDIRALAATLRAEAAFVADSCNALQRSCNSGIIINNLEMPDRLVPLSFKVERINEKTKLALRDQILKHEKNEDRRQLLWYLFQESINHGDNDYKVATKRINEEHFKKHPLDDRTLRSHINRLNKDLDHFFESASGKESTFRVRIATDGSRMLHFLLNEEIPQSGVDLVDHFWMPYLDSERPVQILYPEPQFYRNDSNVYLRHTKVNNIEEARKRFGDGPLMPSYSFVPSGIVGAMTTLLLCFRKYLRMHKTPLEALRVRPSDRPLDLTRNNHLIILATPTSHGTPDVESLVFQLEGGWPLGHEEGTNSPTREYNVRHYDDVQEIIDEAPENRNWRNG